MCPKITFQEVLSMKALQIFNNTEFGSVLEFEAV